MKAVRLHKINELVLDEVNDPVLSGDQILLKIGTCGICGSDIYRAFELGTKVYPVTLGHEFSGTIVKAANPADRSLIGKKAAVFNIVPCFKCRQCKNGNYAHCEEISYLGTRIDGGFADFCIVPSRFNLIVCPSENISFEALAMLEPASVALHAIRSALLSAWNTLVILGAGPIGILAARWAKIFGVDKPLLIDVKEDKVKFAKTRGINAISTNKAIEAVANLTLNNGADIVVEGTGSSEGINMAIELLAHMGKLVLLGNPRKEIVFKKEIYSTILRKEISIVSIWNSYYGSEPINEWEFGMKNIINGRLVVEDLITHKVDLISIPALFRDIYNGGISVCKAVYSLNE